MKRHVYSSYDEYVQEQEYWNRKKLNMVWVKDETLHRVSEIIKSMIPNLTFGLCHGTRRGKEQAFFKKALGIQVLGTEISSTATQFPDTIQWDFQKVKPEWIKAVDFIYSNSFDHAMNPELTIKNWLSCLKSSGLCFIDWSGKDHGEAHVNSLDCFGASLVEMRQWLDKYSVVVDELNIDTDNTVFVLKGK